VYAAAHPDRVRRLILVQVPAESQGLFGSAALEAIRSVVDEDYRTWTEASAAAIFGWRQPEVARAYARFIRQAINENDFRLLRESRPPAAEADLTLRAITQPTLVLYPTTMRRLAAENGQRMTAAIPHAQLLLYDSVTTLPTTDQVTGDILRFLGHDPPTPVAAQTPPPSSQAMMTIILFADIADSTALTERLGDSAFRERARTLDDALRAIVREHGGTPIEGKLLGDGVLATFPAASQAITAALAYEQAAASCGLGLHVGLHAGDVLREANNVFGGAVNIAARISALAAPGEVLVSRTVADLARTSAGVTFEDRGEHALKGIAEPQRVFAVRAAEAG
jgi:hypothetical protein